jgi:hypothetical protein
MELHLHCGLGWLWIVLVVCTSRLLVLSSGYPDELEMIYKGSVLFGASTSR